MKAWEEDRCYEYVKEIEDQISATMTTLRTRTKEKRGQRERENDLQQSLICYCYVMFCSLSGLFNITEFKQNFDIILSTYVHTYAWKIKR